VWDLVIQRLAANMNRSKGQKGGGRKNGGVIETPSKHVEAENFRDL
jgi:hypothetical protein